MKNFDRFIEEVSTMDVKTVELYSDQYSVYNGLSVVELPGLQVKSTEYLSLKHNSDKSGYEGRLRILWEAALTEILLLTKHQQASVLDRLKFTDRNYVKMFDKYLEIHNSFLDGSLTPGDLEMFLRTFFRVPVDYRGEISADFIYEIQDALMLKHGSAIALFDAVRAILNESKPKAFDESGALELIKPELHERLEAVEKRAELEVRKWKQGSDKIGCAAFCELLFQKKYFVSSITVDNWVKNCKAFALRKYGIAIDNQLESAKNSARDTHRSRQNRYFT